MVVLLTVSFRFSFGSLSVLVTTKNPKPNVPRKALQDTLASAEEVPGFHPLGGDLGFWMASKWTRKNTLRILLLYRFRAPLFYSNFCFRFFIRVPFGSFRNTIQTHICTEPFGRPFRMLTERRRELSDHVIGCQSRRGLTCLIRNLCNILHTRR